MIYLKKAELIDTFSGFSVWAILPLLVIIGGFYFAVDYMGNYLLYLALLILLAIQMEYIKNKNLPTIYKLYSY